MLKRLLRRVITAMGYDVVPRGHRRDAWDTVLPHDFGPDGIRLWNAVKPETMTGPERVLALRDAVRHVVKHEIPGDIVECGVWKGGSMKAAAITLLELGDTSRCLHLFDTFEGMPPPLEGVDRNFEGQEASAQMAAEDKATSHVWAYCPLEAVRATLHETGYPQERICFVKGKVEDTLPEHAPEKIAILRLDTDWYESTRHELEHLWPRLSPGGVLIIDDYGYWQGARQAVDEYLEQQEIPLFLARIDHSARLAIKPGQIGTPADEDHDHSPV